MPWVRLTLAMAVALALAATHWKAYVAGQNDVRVKYQAAALEAEQELVAAKQKAEAAYVQEKRKAAIASAGARDALDGLRDAIAERDAAQAAATCTRVDAGAGLERELLGQCAQALVGVAAQADGLEALVVGLQGYVKNVCLKE
jgi:hypothetical protein